MLTASATFARLVTAELKAIQQLDQFAAIVGTDVAAVQDIADPKQLAPLVERWNTYAGGHPPLARVAFYDRGAGSEVSLGHRGTGRVYP